MKKECIVKADGRYLVFYSFERSELVPPRAGKGRPKVSRRRRPQRKER